MLRSGLRDLITVTCTYFISDIHVSQEIIKYFCCLASFIIFGIVWVSLDYFRLARLQLGYTAEPEVSMIPASGVAVLITEAEIWKKNRKSSF